MSLRYLIIFTALTFIVFSLHSFASGSSASNKVSWSDTEMTFNISSHGKSKKDVVDAIDVWGAKTFGSWQNVIQTKLPDRGIIVFRYLEPLCDKRVSVEVKPQKVGGYIVDFSNFTGGECLVYKGVVDELKRRFEATTFEIQKAIAEF